MHHVQSTKAIYVANPDLLSELCEELGESITVIENLVFSNEKKLDVCFAQDVWLDPKIVPFQSITDAVKILKGAGKYWYLHPLSHIRRSRLIEAQLLKKPSLIRHFPIEADIPSLGVFCLLDEHTLVYSAQRLKKWPDGECLFIEDKNNPPNRAYLKLWEALTLLNKYPKAGDSALDLGASPGGWTYVMQSLGATTTAVDKADLAPKIMQLPGIHFLKQSAFALEPSTLEQSYDWVLSDIACYPSRALALIMKWIKSGKAKQMIFTIKLQGKTELSLIKALQDIPNASVVHLFYNKHEATFFYPAINLTQPQ